MEDCEMPGVHCESVTEWTFMGYIAAGFLLVSALYTCSWLFGYILRWVFNKLKKLTYKES